MPSAWKLRAKLLVQRFWQPTSACMTCMPGSLGNVWSLAHWGIALQTGAVAACLALLLSFSPVARLYANRWSNAGIVAVVTALADAWSHPGRYGLAYGEALLTGAVSGLLALAASFLFEDRARRVRAVWARLSGKRH